MAHRIAYYRVSTGDQSIEAQRSALGGGFNDEYSDEGVSGATMAADRPQFAKLLEHVRSGDTIYIYGVDRLGRDAIDVQTTVRQLIKKGVTVDVHGIGPIGQGVGEIILAVLAQLADMERHKILDRCNNGRVAARASLAEKGVTHKGKESLGRKRVKVAGEIAAWRKANDASIRDTAAHFDVSAATVKRYCAEAA